MPAEVRQPPSLYRLPLIWIIVGIFLFVALLHREKELVLIGLIIFAVIGLTWAWSSRSQAGLSFEVRLGRKRVFPGEAFALEVSVQNRNFLPVWLQATYTSQETTIYVEDETAPTLDAALLWHEEAYFRWTLTARKRGVYRLRPSQVLAGDLLGFFPREISAAGDDELLVYPRLVPIHPQNFTSRELFGAPGARSPVFDPVYILGTRDYQPGRPARFIHWRASARHQRWQEKLFEPSAQAKVLLAVDVTRFAEKRAVEDFERALEAAASLSVDLDRQGVHVGLLTNCAVTGGPSFIPAAGAARQPDRLLELLARVRLEAADSLLSRLIRGSVPVRGATVVHFSYEFDDPARAVKGFFEQYNQPVVFLVSRMSEARDQEAGAGVVRPLNSLYLEPGSWTVSTTPA